MKYLIIFLFSFIIASPAFAAKSVPGTAPDLPPLQPAPEGIYPNYSGSIQYIGAPDELNQDTEDSQNQGQISGENQTAKTGAEAAVKNAFSESSKSQTKNFIFLAFVLIVLGAGAYYMRRGK